VTARRPSTGQRSAARDRPSFFQAHWLGAFAEDSPHFVFPFSGPRPFFGVLRSPADSTPPTVVVSDATGALILPRPAAGDLLLYLFTSVDDVMGYALSPAALDAALLAEHLIPDVDLAPQRRLREARDAWRGLPDDDRILAQAVNDIYATFAPHRPGILPLIPTPSLAIAAGAGGVKIVAGSGGVRTPAGAGRPPALLTGSPGDGTVA
jgi:hypothetical protein